MYYEIFEKLCILRNEKPGTVSKATGISTATLTSWKQGKYTPKQDKLQLISDHFGVTIDFLMGKTDKIECAECGQTYNPFDKFDTDIHNTYHQKILQARSIYPSLTPYAEAVRIKAHGLSEIEHYDITDNKITDILFEYLKATFSLFVYRDFEPDKRYDYADFCKSEITRLIKENSIPNESVDYVLDVYGIDKGILIETDTILTRASRNQQLIRILAYVEKLYPETLDKIEIQLKALVDKQAEESKKTSNNIMKFTNVEEATGFLKGLNSFAAFNPNSISDKALIEIANTMYNDIQKKNGGN